MEQQYSVPGPQQQQPQKPVARAAPAAHALASDPAPLGAAAAAAAGVVAAPLRTALLCIDVQSDFMPGGSLAVPRGEEVVAVINKLRRSCRDQLSLVVFTQDYHPPHHVSFASTHLPPPPQPAAALELPSTGPEHQQQLQQPPSPGARQYVRLVYDKATGELLDCSRCGAACRARCAAGGANGGGGAAAVNATVTAATGANGGGRRGGGGTGSRLLGAHEALPARGLHSNSAPAAAAVATAAPAPAAAAAAPAAASPSRASSMPIPAMATPALAVPLLIPLAMPVAAPVAAGEEGALLHAAEAALAALPHADEPAGGAAAPTESASPRAACRAAIAAAWQLESLAAAASEAAASAASAGAASRTGSGAVVVAAEISSLLAAADVAGAVGRGEGAAAAAAGSGGFGFGAAAGGALQLQVPDREQQRGAAEGGSGLGSPLRRGTLVGASGATLQRHLEAKMEQVGWSSTAPSAQLDSGSNTIGASGSSSDSSSGGSSSGGGRASREGGAVSFEEQGRQWKAAAAAAAPAPAGPAEAAYRQQLQQWALEEAQERQAVDASVANARARSAAFHQRSWEADGRQADSAWSEPGCGGAADEAVAAGAFVHRRRHAGAEEGVEEEQRAVGLQGHPQQGLYGAARASHAPGGGDGVREEEGEAESDAATQAAIGAAAHAAANVAGASTNGRPAAPSASPTAVARAPAASPPRASSSASPSAAAAALAGLEVGGAAYPPQPHPQPHDYHHDPLACLHHPRHGSLKHARRSPAAHRATQAHQAPELALQCADSQQQTEVVLQRLWADHCLAGGPGADLHTGLLAALPTDVMLRKGVRRDVDGYSAFFDNGRLHQTPLHRQLRAAGVSRLLVTGVAAEHCVLWTVRDAVRLGYQVWVVSDGVRGVGGAAEAAAREEMAALPAVLMLTAEQVISAAAAWPNAEGLALEPPAPDPRSPQPHPIQ
ncbi:hypothetical protein HXX76_007398 [Chlamydomonas incerta]|uniref:nicotinamidase n=1 Tax=Chlamydomonas incerta TaxID=51695 RepID=A0A835SY77_CHLIN|nr:hypothetical protein HXX76_007398 [Chlamydomonas incerta]|eukprot:KAG2435323.1 hypothetical protein HXX76_007398 [Chlamydomonas incerta]